MNSIERRLRLGLAGSLILLLGFLWLLADIAIRTLSEELIASRLAHDGENLVAALELTPEGPRLGRAPDAIYTRPLSGHYYWVIDSEGRELRSRSLWDEGLAVEPRPVGSTALRRLSGPREGPLLVWSGGFRKHEVEFTLAVAEDLAPLNRALAEYQWYYAGLTLFILAVLLLSQRIILRRSFRPLARARGDVRRLEQGEVSRLTEQVPAEIRPLVEEVNRLLALTAERLKRSRNALGNLAHTIKGPLTVLGQLAESPEIQAHPALARDLRAQIERLRALAERELKRARLGGAFLPGSRFDPSTELPAMIELLQRIHHEKPVAIDWRAETGPLPAEREEMLELLGNLLDNACKWAAGRIQLNVARNSNGIHITVEDDGPGCPAKELTHLAERGTRVDESVPGHGLGLAIVRDIAESYGGILRFDRSPTLGGLRVEVTLQVGKAP